MVDLRRYASLATICLVSSGGCDNVLQLNLIIYDPCNQAALAPVEHIEVLVSDLETGTEDSVVWGRTEADGQAEGFTPVQNGLLSVIGREAGGSGRPGLAVAAASVGSLDLSGEDGTDLVEVEVVIGRVGQFRRTTRVTDSALECTALSGERQNHTATLLADGRVLIAGGIRPIPNEDVVSYWGSVELFNPANGEFVVGPELFLSRQGHTATLLKDGRVLLAGGVRRYDHDSNPDTPARDEALIVAELFNPATGQFDDPITMNEQRAGHTATLLDDGRVLLTGGVADLNTLQTTEIFDPSTSTFSAGPALQERRSFHSAVRVGKSEVLLIGGRSTQVLATTEFISVSGGQSVAGPTLAQARSHLSAALIPNQDAVMVAGGFAEVVTGPENGTGLDALEIIRLDPSGDLASSTAVQCTGVSLNTGRGAAAVGSIGTGLVVAGGVGPSQEVLASGEIIQFGSLDACSVNVNNTENSLAIERGSPVMTELLGGDLLITGGFRYSGNELVSVGEGEIFVRPRQ